MHGGQAAHHRVVAYLDMAGQRSIIRKDNLISDLAIMSDMTVGEKVSAMANGGFALICGATVNRHKFAKGVLIANEEIGWFSSIFQVLTLLPN
jgi:hypothetical protein